MPFTIFPDTPTLNQEFVGVDGITYQWDGVKWVSTAAPMVYLPISGGTMTGALILYASPTGASPALQAATKGYVDSRDATHIAMNPTVNSWTTVQAAIAGLNTAVQQALRGLRWVGAYDAAANSAQFIGVVGIATGPLPAASATGLHPGDYVIVTSSAPPPPLSAVLTGATPPVTALVKGDQLISDGTYWRRVAVGATMPAVTADMVNLNPALNSWTTVQIALTDIHGQLETLEDAVLTTGSYANPTWLTSLAWSKITGAPAIVSGAAGAVTQIQYNAGGGPPNDSFGASANLIWNNTTGRLGVHTAAPAYTVDIAGVLNGISAIHAAYFNRRLGHSHRRRQLPYPTLEKIFETYYSLALTPSLKLSFDYQFIANPAYNTDKGPVNLFAGRVRWAF